MVWFLEYSYKGGKGEKYEKARPELMQPNKYADCMMLRISVQG